jgi:nucleoside-diphosphate-sugar epimerase
VARCLIVACGCRGLALAGALKAEGHAIRGTTRNPTRVAELEAAGVEGVLADPDRVATITPAFAHVGVVCLLLGSAAGSREELAALHSTRLDMLLERMLDTTVRGVVYERAGSVGEELLATGAERVRGACERSLIPFVLLDADPTANRAWLDAATGGVRAILGGPSG